jgi:hypothetical protein
MCVGTEEPRAVQHASRGPRFGSWHRLRLGRRRRPGYRVRRIQIVLASNPDQREQGIAARIGQRRTHPVWCLDVKNGTLTGQEAQQLRANDRSIKQQEHADVKANGGHLPPAEQKQLNQEENANSTLIRDEKHPQ